jgi:hypothetical protein
MTDVDPVDVHPGDLPLPAEPSNQPPEPVDKLPLPQPEDQDAHVDVAHTFSAPLFGDAPAGGWMPTPVVQIGGSTVASAPDSSLTQPLVVDGLSVPWGRSAVMDQPDPATASLTCFDPSSTWPLTTDLRGRLIVISWQITNPAGQLVTVPIFVGRITRAQLRRKTVRRDDGSKVHGLLIALSAGSILNDLANRIPAETWPDESMGARRARIAGFTTNVCTGGVIMRDYWANANVGPVTIDQQVSILDHLLSLYRSSGPDRLTFIPWSQTVNFVQRRDSPVTRSLGQLFWNVAGEGTARDGKGAYAQTRSFAGRDNGMAEVSLYLDGASIEYADDATLTRDITTMITRVEVSHPDQAAGNATRVETQLVSTVDPAVDETVMGVRTARLDSIVNYNNYAQTAASDLAFMAAREAAGWQPDPITIRTKSDTVHGFDSFTQLQYVLLGGEVQSSFFIQRSWFAQLGIRPVFGVIGGVISYRSGEWRAQCNLAPVNTLPTAQHAIAWDEIDDGSATYQLEWHDDEHPRGLHESLTYEDIGFVGLGLGVTGSPATNATWDEVYP